MKYRQWNSGPPPHVGWWNASVCKNPEGWRWWNGQHWSRVSLSGPHENRITPQDLALAHPADEATTRWTDYWPEDARVPRVDPSRPENAGIVACIEQTMHTSDPEFWAGKAWEYAEKREPWPYSVQGLPPEMAKHAEGYAEQLRAERGHNVNWAEVSTGIGKSDSVREPTFGLGPQPGVFDRLDKSLKEGEHGAGKSASLADMGVPTQPIITLDEAHARYRSLAAELKELNESAAWRIG